MVAIAIPVAWWTSPRPTGSPIGLASLPPTASPLRSGAAPGAPTEPTSPSAADGPPPGFSRFSWDRGSFDYPSEWHRYPDLTPVTETTYHLDFLTNAVVDEAAACRIEVELLRCDPDAIELGPGAFLLRITVVAILDPETPWPDASPDRLTTVGGLAATVVEHDDLARHDVKWVILNGPGAKTTIELLMELRKPAEEVSLRQLDALIDIVEFGRQDPEVDAVSTPE